MIPFLQLKIRDISKHQKEMLFHKTTYYYCTFWHTVSYSPVRTLIVFSLLKYILTQHNDSRLKVLYRHLCIRMYVMLAYFGGFPLIYYLKALTETEDTRRIEGQKQLFICSLNTKYNPFSLNVSLFSS